MINCSRQRLEWSILDRDLVAATDRFFFEPDKTFLAHLRHDRLDVEVVYRARRVAKADDAANTASVVDLVKLGVRVEVSKDVARKKMSDLFFTAQVFDHRHESLHTPGPQIGFSAIFFARLCVNCVPEWLVCRRQLTHWINPP